MNRFLMTLLCSAAVACGGTAMDPSFSTRSASAATAEGRAALLHALAHIEFNAINLALDITWRFAALPEVFYRDWVHVAGEEARHFGLLRDRLLAAQAILLLLERGR